MTASGAFDSGGLTGGVYKTRERIHRAVADARLLAIPASRGRIAALDLNWPHFLRFAPPYGIASLCNGDCSTCVAHGVRAVLT